jgi:hypothetical protein
VNYRQELRLVYRRELHTKSCLKLHRVTGDLPLV